MYLAIAVEAGIEDTAQILVGSDEGVGLVQQEGATVCGDEAKQCCGGTIMAFQRLGDDFRQDIQDGGFPTALYRRCQNDIGCEIRHIGAVCVKREKRQGHRRPFRQHAVSLDACQNFFRKSGAVDR